MNKRVFRSKILYYISIIFFSITTLISLSGIVGSFITGFETVNFILLIVFSILSVIIVIKLFEKENNVVKLINIFMTLLLIVVLFPLLISILNGKINSNSIIYSVLIITYLISINKLKVDSKVFDDINDIGKE